MQTYVLNELQWLSMCASGKQSNRLADIASLRPSLTYQKIVIICECGVLLRQHSIATDTNNHSELQTRNQE